MLDSFFVIVTRGAEKWPCHHLSSLFIEIWATLRPQNAPQLLNGIPFTLCHKEFTENNKTPRGASIAEFFLITYGQIVFYLTDDIWIPGVKTQTLEMILKLISGFYPKSSHVLAL
jgi:hypothetical protein